MKRLHTYISIITLLSLASCSKEHSVDPLPIPIGEEKSVQLEVAVPYAPTTRAIDIDQEQAIETLDILSFRADGGGETFLYRTQAIRATGSPVGGASQSFSAMLRLKDFPQRFVLITNAHTKVETLIGSRVDGWVGIEKEGLLSRLTFDLNGGDRWNAAGAQSYTPIPMWGETAPKTIAATTISISETPIPMLRMVAKVDVQLDQSVPNLTNKFKLKSVHVYNTNTSGRVAPKSGIDYIEQMTAKKASLPAPVTSVTGPLAYTDLTPPVGIPNVAMRGAIYLFETAAKNVGNFLEETCIVVGGYYDTDNFESFYRLDFYGSDGATHIDLLRNHRYICNIIEVKGRGHNTVDEAYRTKSYNMKADIIAWNEGVNSNVLIDGQYMLGVSSDSFVLSEGAHGLSDLDNILQIVTNHPDGWTATVWADKAGTIPVPWLTLSVSTGAGDGQYHDTRLLMGANSGAARTAYVLVKAGRMSNVVSVTQKLSFLGVYPGSGTPIAQDRSYVGAFWRHNQTGERIIRISNITGAANLGDWTASVAWMDDQWSAGDIVLDTSQLDVTSLASRNISFTSSATPYNNPKPAEDYPLSGTAQSVSGTVASGGDIIFRIGLKSKFTAYHEFNNPARYAVVLLEFNLNGTPKYHKIFLRQGEGADNVATETSPVSRAAIKWSPYNVGNYNNQNYYGGFNKIVDFPTKAGYLYQWAYGKNAGTDEVPRPYPPQGSSISPPWTDIMDPAAKYTLTNVCPTNYKVPTGNTDGTSESESLIYKSFLFGSESSISGLFGYYADGYFDRRQIRTATGTQGEPDSAVSIDNDDVAYKGLLFFNSSTNASLFFPAVGRRNAATTELGSAGGSGHYWSSTAYTTGYETYVMNPHFNGNSYGRAYASQGYSVRCIAQ